MEEVLYTSHKGDIPTTAVPIGIAKLFTQLSIAIPGGEMPQKIFAFRHVKSIKNHGDAARAALEQGVSDREMDLSERGFEDLYMLEERAGTFLAAHGLEGKVRIIHSPYKRTVLTAEAIVVSLLEQAEPRVEISAMYADERLRDHNSGAVLGLSHEEARAKFPEYARAMDQHKHAYLDAVPPGGECKREMVARVNDFRREIAGYEEHIILVTHFDIIVALIALSELDEHQDDEKFDDRMLEMLSSDTLWDSTGSVTEFDLRPDGNFIVKTQFHKLW